jgi:hypothetical protein
MPLTLIPIEAAPSVVSVGRRFLLGRLVDIQNDGLQKKLKTKNQRQQS